MNFRAAVATYLCSTLGLSEEAAVRRCRMEVESVALLDILGAELRGTLRCSEESQMKSFATGC
jgi:hypothetical protein